MLLYYTLLSTVVLTIIFVIILEKVIKPKIKAAKEAALKDMRTRIARDFVVLNNKFQPPPGPSGISYDVSGQNITTSSGVPNCALVSGTYANIELAAQEEYKKVAAEDRKDEHSILLDIINTMPPS